MVQQTDIKIITYDKSHDDKLFLQLDRYSYEFEEISRLGRGGFGAVYKVWNKIDNNYYAIKKVKLNCMFIYNNNNVLNIAI